MAKRKVIRIDEEKCNGCGLCIPNCPEGALEIQDGKARLVSDIVCDGLGACLGECPEGAISIEYREAEAYDEAVVMANLLQQDPAALNAHLKHLQDHGETELYRQAIEYLDKHGDHGIAAKGPSTPPSPAFSGCPGSRSASFAAGITDGKGEFTGQSASQLTHWPIQMHLIQPLAPHFRDSHLLLAADCVAHAYAEFHRDFLKGKALIIACPKLDEGQDVYLEKLIALIDQAGIQSITVAIMEVPCCSGLLRLVQTAVNQASRKIPIECSVVGIQGRVLEEATVSA